MFSISNTPYHLSSFNNLRQYLISAESSVVSVSRITCANQYHLTENHYTVLIGEFADRKHPLFQPTRETTRINYAINVPKKISTRSILGDVLFYGSAFTVRLFGDRFYVGKKSFNKHRGMLFNVFMLIPTLLSAGHVSEFFLSIIKFYVLAWPTTVCFFNFCAWGGWGKKVLESLTLRNRSQISTRWFRIIPGSPHKICIRERISYPILNVKRTFRFGLPKSQNRKLNIPKKLNDSFKNTRTKSQKIKLTRRSDSNPTFTHPSRQNI